MAAKNGASVSYESYIRASAERVWQAITVGSDTRHYYYGSEVRSSWKVGAEVVYLTPDGSAHFVEGKVLEVQPGRKMVLEGRFLWDPKFAKDRPHRETWAIEPMGEQSKLTVTFDRLEAGSGTAADTEQGLPFIVSSLKSFLETGQGLNMQG